MAEAAAAAAAAAAAGGGQPQIIEALAALLDNRLAPLLADLGTLQGQVNGIQLQQLQVAEHPAVRSHSERKDKEPLCGEVSAFFPRKPDWRSQSGLLFVETLPVSTTQGLRVADHASASVKKHYSRSGEQARIELDTHYTLATFLFDIIREQETLIQQLDPGETTDRFVKLAGWLRDLEAFIGDRFTEILQHQIAPQVASLTRAHGTTRRDVLSLPSASRAEDILKLEEQAIKAGLEAAAKERYKQKGRDAYSAPFSTAGRKTDGDVDFRQAIDAIYSHYGAGGGGGKGKGPAGGGAPAYPRGTSPAGRESHYRAQGQASPRTRGEKTRAGSREPGPAKP